MSSIGTNETHSLITIKYHSKKKTDGNGDNMFVINAIINFLTKSNCPPIQVQVVDIEKCFDKMWLQSTINAIYEAGIDHDQLNLLYIENKNANITVKINNKLSGRTSVRDVIMQGSVWGSLKCTTLMDQLNKTAMSDKSLKYLYKGDPSIPIGILGMVDGTLSVSECGNNSVRKTQS